MAFSVWRLNTPLVFQHVRSEAGSPAEGYVALITKHIVSMALVRLKAELRPLFPYECEIPTGPSMWDSGSSGHFRTGSPPVVQFVRFLGRIRVTPQNEEVLLKDDIQLFRKIQLIITNYLTQFTHTPMCKNSTSWYFCLPFHQPLAKFSSNFIEIIWWVSFHHINQLHYIWKS